LTAWFRSLSRRHRRIAKALAMGETLTTPFRARHPDVQFTILSRTSTEILAHLADSEIVTGWRMRQILGAPGTPIQPFDQDAWAAAGHYEKRDARKSLEQYRVAREGNLALLKSLTAEQWKHHGMHAERGVETIEHITYMMAGHDLNHTAQIERIVAAKKRGERIVRS